MSSRPGATRVVSQGDELERLAKASLDALEDRWSACLEASTAVPPPAPRGESPFYQLGRRLGQFVIGVEPVADFLRGRLGLLRQAWAMRLQARLVAHDVEAASILSVELPEVAATLKLLQEERRGLNIAAAIRLGWQGSLLDLVFYGFTSFALFLAELSLATQVTQEALLLRNPILFSLALASLTLIFKLLADRLFSDSSRIGLVYICCMAVLFVLLMFFVADLRTETVLAAGEDDNALEWEDEDLRAEASATSEDEQASTTASLYLKFAFFVAAILFPLLSGVGFSLFQRAIDVRNTWRRSKKRLKELQTIIHEVEEQRRTLHARLAAIAEEAIQAIAALGGSFNAVVFYSSRAAEVPEEVTSAQGEEEPSTEAENPSAGNVSEQQGDSGVPLHAKLERDFQSRLLRAAMASQNDGLEDMVTHLGDQIEGELRAGFALGGKMKFSLFAGESTEELLRIADLERYHNRLYVDGRNEGTNGERESSESGA